MIAGERESLANMAPITPVRIVTIQVHRAHVQLQIPFHPLDQLHSSYIRTNPLSHTVHLQTQSLSHPSVQLWSRYMSVICKGSSITSDSIPTVSTNTGHVCRFDGKHRCYLNCEGSSITFMQYLC